MLDYALIGALSAAVVAEPAPVRGGCISAPLRRLLAPLSRPARGIAGLSMRAALPSRNCRKKGNLFMFKKRKVRNKKERNCPSSWQQKVRMERLPSFTSYFFFSSFQLSPLPSCVSFVSGSSDAFCCISPILIHGRREEAVCHFR
ncbi:uncharacterized protein LOC106999362 isoform X3 [Macaca mulatta]